MELFTSHVTKSFFFFSSGLKVDNGHYDLVSLFCCSWSIILGHHVLILAKVITQNVAKLAKLFHSFKSTSSQCFVSVSVSVSIMSILCFRPLVWFICFSVVWYTPLVCVLTFCLYLLKPGSGRWLCTVRAVADQRDRKPKKKKSWEMAAKKKNKQTQLHVHRYFPWVQCRKSHCHKAQEFPWLQWHAIFTLHTFIVIHIVSPWTLPSCQWLTVTSVRSVSNQRSGFGLQQRVAADLCLLCSLWIFFSFSGEDGLLLQHGALGPVPQSSLLPC